MKRDSVSGYVHMKLDTRLPLDAPIQTLDDPPPLPSIPPVAYVLNRWPVSQPKDK